jgi:hypothetical protein
VLSEVAANEGFCACTPTAVAKAAAIVIAAKLPILSFIFDILFKPSPINLTRARHRVFQGTITPIADQLAIYPDGHDPELRRLGDRR